MIGTPMHLPGALRLYFVVGRADCAGRPLGWVVEQAVLGGVTAVQLREKQADSREVAELARGLRGLLDPLAIPLIVNDDVEAAIASGASGLHVGQEDLAVAEARRRLPGDCRLGLSITNRHEATAARGSDADHLGVGPVFATGSKADAAPALGLAGLAEVCALRPELPAVAIGGISAERAAAVMASGVAGIAVVSAIAATPDPRSAAQELRRIVDACVSERKKAV